MYSKQLAVIVFALLSFLQGSAQNGIEMADRMRAEGKIYVVVTVIAIIFLGITAYLVRLDRRISKLEEEETMKSKS